MRFLFFWLLILTSCAWNKFELFKDVDKDLSKSTNKKLEKMGVEKELLEKFTVDTVEPVKNEEPTKTIPTTSTTETKKVILPKKKEPLPVKKTKVVSKPKYPPDYPQDMLVMSMEAEPVWKKFVAPFKEGEVSVHDIEYGGVTVGKIVISYSGIKKMNNKEVYHFTARFKSAPFYSAFYELDDKVDSFVQKDEFFSLRYNLVQRESKQNIDEVQLFDRENYKTQAFAKISKDKGKKIKNKNWEGFIPHYSVDAFSVIFLLRGLPLNIGDSYKIPVVNKGKVLTLTCEVEAYEEINTKAGKVKSIKLKAETKYTGHTLKSGDMTFWFTHDEKRELIRSRAKINLGSVYTERVPANSL